MPGIAIKPTVQTELQRQLNQELFASQSYLALAAWCDINNYKGFAAYFSKQATEERAHSQKIIEHLSARGVQPEFAAMPAAKGEFKSLQDVANKAQSMERSNTDGINKVFEAALKEKDYPAQVLMHWFINEQVEEEDWADELVDRVQHATCAGGIMYLDRHLEKYLTDESISAVAKA